MGLLGVFGNALVLLVIVVVRDLHDVANVLIGNQSLIDLLTSLLLLASFVAPLPPLPTNNPTLSRFVCAFWYSGYSFWSLIVASSLNLTLMTLERYYAIVFPLHYHSRTNSARFICLVALPWLSGFAYHQDLVWFTRVEQDQCLGLQFPNDATRAGFAFGAAFLQFVLPLAVMVFVYTSISIKLKSTVEEKFNKRARKNRESEKSVSQNLFDPVKFAPSCIAELPIGQDEDDSLPPGTERYGQIHCNVRPKCSLNARHDNDIAGDCHHGTTLDNNKYRPDAFEEAMHHLVICRGLRGRGRFIFRRL
ncbi:5-hydroxytryptamine receptor 1A-like [Strongylocentrotus purpuratus]|uniref:G-protein coupled receptors family 1 profile domain-containing protein n=1 Tax=Strongylocentrotus purpuratus TaxID=7668 RepID=A0A7M7P9J2_STRPU|nr:5-hydroxytryptamine receptor 1A-like [Strongylocentrotus purpuratus]